MTTEEKYDKALELARTYYNGGNEFLDTIFPELKESEDERIRRDIIHYILYKADGVSEEQEHSWIAYLEKQKEPLAPEEKMNHPLYLEGFDVGREVGAVVAKPAEWSEEDEEIVRFYEMDYNNKVGDWPNKDVVEMRLKFKDWLLNRLKFIRPQPRQEWSEEDEKVWQDIFDLCNRFGYDDACRKLKSLRPQPAWKPSEQEKGALRTAICVLTEERNFPKTAGHLQAILDAFEGKESHKGWKPSDEQMRYYLRKIGYIIDRGSSVAYYDENTRRSLDIEGRKKGDRGYVYFDFKPLDK